MAEMLPQNPVEEEETEANQLLLRHASQSSLDESSQRQSQREPAPDRPPYRNTSHSARAFQQMFSMRRERALCDVILEVDTREIYAHKVVLASASPYFRAMFTSFEESRQNRVKLQEMDPTALEALVDYIYSSEIRVTENNVQILLPASNLLQLGDVRDACCEFLQSHLHPTNCLGIRSFADLHGCVDLKTNADAYIELNFSEVVECEEFLTLTADQVIQLISCDRLSVANEEKVYECVLRWINYDLPAREQHLADLMSQVRLPLLSRDFLVQQVKKEPLLQPNAACKDFLIEALLYHLSVSNDGGPAVESLRTKPRQPVGLPKILLVVGGQAPKAIRSVEAYDLKQEKWLSLSEMPIKRCRCGVAVLDGKVYTVGGFNGCLRIRTVDLYNPQTDTWQGCVNMEVRRSTLGVAVLNDCIYAVGGFDGCTGLNTAEVFDPRVGEWKMIEPMSVRRSSVGVGVVNGILYAVGGYDGASRHCLSSVEAYNPELDRWTMVAEMNDRRSGTGVGVLDGLLYAVGGHDGPTVRKSVEVYNPLINTWSPVANMSTCRRNAGVVAHHGLLYVVGGDDGAMTLKTVEVYNPKTDTWTLLPTTMSTGRSYAGVAVIDRAPGQI
ncbi:Ring canal kelch [Amphibalanus amphitrite]|uniref:Kelch-like protein diablo n=1 Tax=Amphibalanus amphitrite TaxID=1232801 RepID=A0A6A4WNX7_AMPAM|nr:ring canal kelch homolog [Amphibalanus amphitrite]KAF0303651.1 Ring canal kelch [Amphibalanus amphitrite]